jgi:hypothetical protein
VLHEDRRADAVPVLQFEAWQTLNRDVTIAIATAPHSATSPSCDDQHHYDVAQRQQR